MATPGLQLTVGGCDCCVPPCTPAIIASYTTSLPYNPTWDLTPYQGAGIATGNTNRWLLIEVGLNVTHGSGNVALDGTLTGLPASFTTTYDYNGYMQLQVGCSDNGSPEVITWP